MTPLELQDELVAEMQKIFAGNKYQTPAGERVPINVFAQSIPVNESDEDDDPIPYIIIRLNSGEDKGGRDSNNTVKLVVIIGIYDHEREAQGHRDVMNIIQKVYQRFHEDPNLNGKAVYAGEFDWAMQEDTYYPYSFGACSLSFHIAAIRREDPFA